MSRAGTTKGTRRRELVAHAGLLQSARKTMPSFRLRPRGDQRLLVERYRRHEVKRGELL